MRLFQVICTSVAVAALSFAASARAEATEWFVAPGGTGDGTQSAPFGHIQDAIDVAQAGDVIAVEPGTYAERLRTVRDGMATLPIRLRATTPDTATIVTAVGRVLTVQHAHFVVDGLILDGQYGTNDTLKVLTSGTAFTLQNSEVRRSTYDLIDMDSPTDVLIEGCVIHHALNAAGGRTDAHGIAGAAVQHLTIRNTDIHTFSGDGVQIDPSRSAPGWNDVTLENVRIWLAPLPAAENGFRAGAVPGENAIDTKADATLPRAKLTVRNMTAWGFRNGLITNMAAFNLKENIDATLHGVTVYDSEIAFRLRGGGTALTGAWVTIKNAVVHDVITAYRYEDNIQNLHIWNNTVGNGVTRAFQPANSTSAGVDVQNFLVLGSRPPEAMGPSNLGVTAAAFVDAANHDYRLADESPAIDKGTALASVRADRDGLARPVGSAYDVGAYEWQPPSRFEVVFYARHAPTVIGEWQLVNDATAAGGARLWHANARAKTIDVQAVPANYFQMAVNVRAGIDYHLWIRGKAEHDSPLNDSVWVQFSSSVDAAALPIYRIGTTSAARVNLEDCQSCGLSGWGWQDNGSVRKMGVPIRFATTGNETIRIQTREDGMSIDQIVLSPTAYLNAAPGQLKNDATILAETY